MAAVRSFAAVLLSFLALTATAQNIVVTVVDTSGARIPGAQIGIIKLPDAASKAGDWLNYALHTTEQVSTHADASGQATVDLGEGSYALSISAPGFQRHLEMIEMKDGSSHALQATLLVNSSGCGVCVTPGIAIETDPAPSLNIFIPLEPLKTMTVSRSGLHARGERVNS